MHPVKVCNRIIHLALISEAFLSAGSSTPVGFAIETSGLRSAFKPFLGDRVQERKLC